MKHLVRLSRLPVFLAAAALLTGAATAAEEIDIQQGGSSIADGGSKAFGSVNVGSSTPLTFTIRNTGDASLTGVAVTKSGTNAGDFTVSALTPPAASIPAGSSATFTVTFAPGASGARTAALSIASSDADENPYDITLTGTGLSPEINVVQGSSIASGGSKSFGTVDYGSSTPLTFTIENSGNANLTGLAITKSGANPGDFTVTANPTAPVAAGGSTTFTVSFSPGGRGARSAAISIASNDTDESAYVINLSGTGRAAEIAVDQGGNINTGGSKSFGNVEIGTNSSLTFTISNTGDASLTGLVASLGGTHASDYSITTNPTAPVTGPTGTTTFTVRFAPTGRGARTAAVSLTNNDPDGGESPFVINLTGTGTAPEIAIEGPSSATINSGGSQDFGSVVVGATGKLTFTIRNTGDANLSGLGVTIDGAHKDDYAVASPPSASVVGGGGVTTFVVNFTPSAGGTRTAALHVTNNDPDGNEAPYNINITGTGDAPASGSDGFGYTMATTPVNALNLRTTDADVVTAADLNGDDYVQAISIGFPFSFYDQTYTSLLASTNGLITFGSGTGATSYSPLAIPNAATPNNFIAPFWTDLVKGSSSNILYATRGSAPNRVFIIDYQDMEEYSNSSARISFQVILYEGSNSIEMQFKKLQGITSTRAASIGIEGPTGNVGISHKSGTDRPSIPSAITFSRPVVVKVESKFQKPDGTMIDVGTSANGLNPEIGTIKVPYDSVKRFEAPEFIYLDETFNQLDAGAGDYPPPSGTATAYYRLVNDGYAIDGQVIQGTHTFFTSTLNHDVTVIWRWKLQYAAFIETVGLDGNPLSAGAGVGNPSPSIGRHWVDKDTSFSASIDRAVGNDSLGLDVAGFRYTAKTYQLDLPDGTSGLRAPPEITALGATGNRVATVPITITGWTKVTWTMAAQVRYRFAAAAGAGDGTAQFLGQSFVRVYDATDRSVLETGTPVNTNPRLGTSTLNEIWIDAGRKVDVGAFYRTADRCFTLGDFVSPPGGNLNAVGTDISVFRDEMVNDNPTLDPGDRVARIYTVQAATAPTEISFRYVPTVFRAEIPLGEGFDATNPDLQLVPNLCDGGVLRADDEGPANTFTRIGAIASGQATGNPVRWDQLGKTLFPVHPGSYQLDWPDANVPGKSYKIEVVAAYPGDTATLATARETKLADGNSVRQVAASSFVFNTTLPRVDAAFPGSVPAPQADAHYRHLYDPIPARTMPTKLDISGADEWSFRELTYTDQGTGATVDTSTTKAFNVTGSGRSVLLYSYRPNPDETADGTANKERLAVRVVRSSPSVVIPRIDPRLVLGQHGLQLGNGLASSGGAFGVVQTGATPATSSVTSGDKFVVDFWLNAKGVRESAPVTLDGCTTVQNSTELVCESTAGIVPGMTLTGTNIPAGTKVVSVTNATTLVLGAAATGSAGDLAIVASNKPVTILSTGGGGLKVTLDPAAATVTANLRGVPVTHSLPAAGAAWRHHAIHVFTTKLFGISVTVMDYYLDGVRKEQSFVTSWFPGTADSTVGTSVNSGSLRLGADANPLHGLAVDQFRFFHLGSDTAGYLKANELRALRTERDMTTVAKQLRGNGPQLWFSFEAVPSGGRFPNLGSLPNVAIGPVTGSGIYAGTWANTDLQEVATRIDSTLDNAGFKGTGYILNAVSNYNASLYNRDAEVGTWGPVFPVNHSRLFTDASRKLEITYYENPWLTDRSPNPNVAWPYVTTEFQNVTYPLLGADKDKRIYIASRIGSEGVDRTGRPQPVYDLAAYSGLKVYNQPDPGQAGYNPNEEHALAAASGRAALKVKSLGDGVPNNPPLAAFALQADANQTTTPYTSEPWVLIQVENLRTGEPEMAAYSVRKTRTGSVAFPRPSDAVVQSTPGLAYEPAENPEDRFLTLDPDKAYDLAYKFDYPVFAGDLVIPPYPLNIVIGNVSMQDERGGNIQVGGVNRRTLWRDVNKKAWVVSGDGRFFNQYFYPMRGDFYLPSSPSNGTPVAWLPAGADFTGIGTDLEPVKVLYSSKWRSDYPKLKRGETLTYQGGEYFNENPGSNGLPALVAMAAAEIVYDSSTPDMVIGTASTAEVAKASAQIIRPLDRREKTGFTAAQMSDAGFTPAETAKLLIIAERWYFKELPGSLGNRFYYDSLASTLVFRGYLNEKDSGDPDLTAGPDPLNLLEPNVMTADEYETIRALSDNGGWQSAVDDIFKLSQNPNGVTSLSASVSSPVFLQGVKQAPSGGGLPEVKKFWKADLSETVDTPDPVLTRLDSFGVGSALVPNSSLLTQQPNGSLYVTIAENNRSELNGAAVSLHIIEIVPDRYRGAIKVVESADAFSEKVMLIHNGEFGANTGDLYYEWWIRDAAPLDLVATEVLPNGTLAETDSSGHTLWQQYLPQSRIEDGTLTDTEKHLGLQTIVFEGRPDVTLADKLVLMRYRHKNESSWNLVPFEFANASTAWKPGTPAPFQWAGAANSPQLQADGSKRYIPQLVMGWVKRVLDRINPYEARYADFFSNESPATYTSQIQIAGGPFAGKVALNSDKNVIENTGLIELYETVLQRAKELSIDNSSNPVSTDGINQALLLAATRLSTLYELLAQEAYSDAQDPTITVGDDDGLDGVASFTHAFQNFEPDLLHEELSLLRGTDFRKSYPVYNRMFWNYAKGLGEAAYNVNYNIYDANTDGFINEDDARILFPQGHGDAWGHFVNAIDKHYDLLQATNFSWRSRSELYSLMQNVLEVDYLDEKSFAKLAAGRARAGRDIVRGTYRLKYTQNPDGQWQGYTDSADPARAWGVSEWGHRAGQAAYFDWAVANALLPEDASGATPVPNPEGLDKIERSGAIDEIGEIAAAFHEIQVAMDEADGGVNPLGFDSDAITFDIDPFYDHESWEGQLHFEQIYERAVAAGENALATLDFAAQADNKLRRISDDTDELLHEAMRQDLDYRNRLIEIFGRPYSGTIGFGKAFPEGYEGPDNLLFAYLDRTKVEQVIPDGTGSEDTTTLEFNEIKNTVIGLASNKDLVDIYKSTSGGSTQLSTAVQTFILGNSYEDPTATFTMPIARASDYGYKAPDDWGQRTSYGRIQRALEEMLREEVALKGDIDTYVAFLGDYETLVLRLRNQIELIDDKEGLDDAITGVRAGINSTVVAVQTGIGIAKIIGNTAEGVAEAIAEAFPTSVGFSNDVTSIGRGIALASAVGFGTATDTANDIAEIGIRIAELVRDEVIARLERDGARVDYVSEVEGMMAEIELLSGAEAPMRAAIGERLQNLEILRQEYFTAQAEGFRLLREREAFNKSLAAMVQKNRYQDMVLRLSRNEAMGKYQTAFNHAARYTWLTAKAYDFETSLDPGHSAAPGPVYDQIVKERQLGLWSDGVPAAGQGGLAEILNHLNGNFQVLKGQLGINNPQFAAEKISLRGELFRIGPPLDDGGTAASDDRWKDALKARIVPDLNKLPEFVRYCRPFASTTTPQPGIVIRFPTCIEPGLNVFGRPLLPGDHSYSSANFATKVRAFGVWLENYNAANLSTTPRAYMVPIGNDFLRTSTSTQPFTRMWSVNEQRIPTPFVINQSNLSSPGYIPTLNGVDGGYGELRRHGDFRMYHDNGDPEADDSELILDSRLIGRSVWNSEWMLVIPGAGLHADPTTGLTKLADTIGDIKLHFKTYSHQGQ
ncbi:MAG: choice-of-anchor D domain-containing protein [Akkermansiaceae bacterium]|nr:choice-of-anchor D domain-containing protein [Akkermansiaceae bacterium]MCP5547953.1 choice-of-anchor D domain-containing protein [Akkermansiaceae bacterium]